MSISSWFRSGSSWISGHRRAAPRKARPRWAKRLCLTLERLEDRTVPATIPVNTFADVVDANDGLTSLREAITLAADATTHAGDDAIVLPHEIGGVAGTYALSLGELAIDDATGKLTIMSDGGPATIDAQGASGVFEVFAGSEVVFQGLTITGGSADSGGGLYNGGKATLTASTLSGNSAPRGGGIFNTGAATLTVTGSTLCDNKAGTGGGLFNDGGQATLTDSTVSGNSITGFGPGGGILNFGAATLTVTGSTLSHNSATLGAGGGIWNDATATFTASTLSDNSATRGGGIFNVGGATLSVTATTLKGNSASDLGGGIFTIGRATITDSTLSGNTGDGVYLRPFQDGGTQLLGNTITGNSKSGVLVSGAVVDPGGINHFIGSPFAGNTIAFNGGAGVAVEGPITGITIRGNAIYGNAGPGIDLGNDGLTANDPGDADDGPNHLQNLPVLVMARSAAAGTTISGTLNSTANSRFLIDFYAIPPAGSPPGMTYIGAALVRTDGSGNGDFEATLPTRVAAGWGITATATTTDAAPFGNTSELALVFPVFDDTPPNRPPVISNQAFSLKENSGNGTVVGTVAASDPDAGQTLSYQVTAGNASGAFAIDAATGRITVANAAALDFEATPAFVLTVQVTDSGTPARLSTATVTVNLTNVNEAPANRLPTAPQALARNKSLTFSQANGNAISVSDPDGGAAVIRVTLTVQHGKLTLAVTAGLTFQIGDGKGDSTMTFRGTIAAINAALDGLTYAPDKGYTGSDSLSISTNDLGSGLGDPLIDTDVVAILVGDQKK
jgi:hypothetical protein